jgi:hypothetical protein
MMMPVSSPIHPRQTVYRPLASRITPASRIERNVNRYIKTMTRAIYAKK